MLDAGPVPILTQMRLTFDAARLIDWVRFDRRDLGLALILAAAVTVINVSASVQLLDRPRLLDIAAYAGYLFVDTVVLSVPLVAALIVLERLPIHGWRRHLTTVATGAVTTGLVFGPVYFLLIRPQIPNAFTPFPDVSGAPYLLFAMWMSAAMALIARAWLVESREATDASKLLARMRSEQTMVRRRLVEGRLRAIQARVDPLFFFAMLETVQKTYTVDVDRAEQLLDELTAFLRAALPRLRTASSTVDQECELARSFARLHVLAGRGTSRLDVDVAQSAGGAAFPPGVLLPLVDELLRTAKNAGSVGISFLIDGEGQIESTRRTVILHLNAQQQLSDEAVARTRATLFDLFGATATIAGAVVDGVVRTTLRVPYEPASA